MIIKIQGGLGNQMFQYAYGRNLELNGKKVTFDISTFNKNIVRTDTARNFRLDNFKIETKAEFSDKLRPVSDFINKALVKLNLKQDGFWQSEKYFNKNESNIRKEFDLKKPLSDKFTRILDQIANTHSVSIHVRRGDYVNSEKTNAFHGVCDLEYYNQAISIIKAQIGNPTFFIFSDDIDWVSRNLELNSPTWWVSELKAEDYEELIVMSKCRHNIIANSTFSWWGAWLNQNPNKVVIAPKQWLANKTSDELNILPKEWIQI